jgi:hypothetical protein
MEAFLELRKPHTPLWGHLTHTPLHRRVSEITRVSLGPLWGHCARFANPHPSLMVGFRPSVCLALGPLYVWL